MRKLLFPALLTVAAWSFLWACNTGGEKSKSSEQADSARIVFEQNTHDFGQITEGEVVSTTYSFKNTGTRPLEILDVNVSCGCTVAEKPEKPVGVGQKGEIKVNFNSEGKPGINKKYITVVSNASNSSEILSFSVIVNKKEEIKTN